MRNGMSRDIQNCISSENASVNIGIMKGLHTAYRGCICREFAELRWEDRGMKGKEKCKALKEIRRQIAEENDIPYVVSQCTYQGDCKGTCPKCESELRYLERELAIRQGLGKAVAVVGISASVCGGLTASPTPGSPRRRLRRTCGVWRHLCLRSGYRSAFPAYRPTIQRSISRRLWTI